MTVIIRPARRANITQPAAHIYDRATGTIVLTHVSAAEVGSYNEGQRSNLLTLAGLVAGMRGEKDAAAFIKSISASDPAGSSRFIFTCPGCLEDNHIHRLNFRQDHEQLRKKQRRDFTLELKTIVTPRHVPHSFVDWQGETHACALKDRDARYKTRASKYGFQLPGDEETPHRFLARMQRFPRAEPDFSVTELKKAHSWAARNGNLALSASQAAAPAGTHIMRKAKHFQKLYEAAGGDPQLLAMQVFYDLNSTDPNQELSGTQIFLYDPLSQFYELLRSSKAGEDHVSLSRFEALPESAWKNKYKTEKGFTIPGRGTLILHEGTKFFVGMRLCFQDEQLYNEVKGKVLKRGHVEAVSVSAYGHIDIETYEEKIKGLQGTLQGRKKKGKSGSGNEILPGLFSDAVENRRKDVKDRHVIWMDYPIHDIHQIWLPKPQRDAATPKKKMTPVADDSGTVVLALNLGD